MPKISIQIPVYNGEKYLSQTLSSVLENSPPDVEVFITDNGSADNSLDIIREFAGADNRIVYEKYTGGRSSRAYMVQNTGAEYIIPFDHDDIMAPGRLAAQAAFLDTHPDCAMTYGRTYAHDGDSLSFYAGAPFSNFGVFVMSNPIGCGSVMARREVMLEAGNFISFIDPESGRVNGSGDFFLWQRMASIANLHYDDDCPAYIYRCHPGQISRGLIGQKTTDVTVQTMVEYVWNRNKKEMNDLANGLPFSCAKEEIPRKLQLLAVLYFFCPQLEHMRDKLLTYANKAAPDDSGLAITRILHCLDNNNPAKAIRIIDKMLQRHIGSLSLQTIFLKLRIKAMQARGYTYRNISICQGQLQKQEEEFDRHSLSLLEKPGFRESTEKYLQAATRRQGGRGNS